MMRIPPQTMEELNAQLKENLKIEGVGLGNVHVHLPCPFCAAPDFVVYEVLQVLTELGKDHTCRECERSVRALSSRTGFQTLTEFVQTGGPAQPDWFEPKLRVYT